MGSWLLGRGLLHLGTDGAGSLRIPAAFTGVFGMKPSFGRVPVYPALLLNVLSHQGPITRTVDDAARMLSVIAQPDHRDMAAWNTPAPDFTAGLDDGVRGLRVAYSAKLGQDLLGQSFPLDPDIDAAARKAVRALEEQGAIVEEADPALPGMLETIQAMWWPVAAAIVDAVPPERRPEMDPGFLAIAEKGRKLTVADYLAAYTGRSNLHTAMLAFHARYDVLLTPAMPLTALKVGIEAPEDGAFGDDFLNWTPYTYPFNLTQQPAASVPTGLARNGLPMGAQIVGRLGADAMVLRAAKTIERAMPMPKPPGLI